MAKSSDHATTSDDPIAKRDNEAVARAVQHARMIESDVLKAETAEADAMLLANHARKNGGAAEAEKFLQAAKTYRETLHDVRAAALGEVAAKKQALMAHVARRARGVGR